MLSSAFLTFALATAAFSHPTKRQTGGVITSCTVPNTAALTIVHDGPYIYSQNIVDMLDAKGVKGTFFSRWQQLWLYIRRHRESSAAERVLEGSSDRFHTWAHKDSVATLTTDQVENEFTLTDSIRIGENPRSERRALQVAAAYNQSVIIWDFDSGDSVGETAANSEKDYDTLVTKYPNTILTLNHETVETTRRVIVIVTISGVLYRHICSTTVLPHALDDLLGAGYNLVTVAECLSLPPYLSVAARSAQDVRLTPRSFWLIADEFFLLEGFVDLFE
ncbi:hypothetical protein ARMGADRAFT_1090222 [Armillaria gallica]|uniref:Chitin deacetylase n=1 Tax=Armillaria gallica TaxID=47427 RepID=A0A2H3CTM0_ARMGA|nr:hypothetical protein ARMGADRAFT_1090222 [Armillaria gallica]